MEFEWIILQIDYMGRETPVLNGEWITSLQEQTNEGGEKTSRECPNCHSKRNWKDGIRETNFGSVQRFICRICGARFSEKSYKDCLTTVSRRLCATSKAKKLDTQAETKTVCAGEKRLQKLPQETRGLLTEYMAYLERQGAYAETSYIDLLKSLASDGADLINPEDVKEKIARHKYKDKLGQEQPWKDSTKMLAVYAYDAFCRMKGIEWIKPRYRQGETVLIVPEEKDLQQLKNSFHSRRMVAFIQTIEETFADPGEILRVEWKELNGNILTINHPVKGHYPGQCEISSTLVAMLNNLPKKDKRIFPMTYSTAENIFIEGRKRAAAKFQNPRLLQISFKSWRHYGGSKLSEMTNGNYRIVKAALRHKSILNTEKYIHTIKPIAENYDTTCATTLEEILALGKAGWTKYDEIALNGKTVHCYKKLMRFGGAKSCGLK
jgi:integrase